MRMPLEIYVVRGHSMRPSLREGDVLIVRSLRPGARLKRGDIVAALDPRERTRRTLKRVIGLSGEEIALVDGELLVNGAALPEPYLRGGPPYLGEGGLRLRLGAGEVFLMGDNRLQSTDSRDYGPVHVADVLGRVRWRLWAGKPRSGAGASPASRP
ncbi:MAG: signal peptidase I [SAR202 cluster bacterium]|nr:signal peptidase I [SAR202 cluster bacterium]